MTMLPCERHDLVIQPLVEGQGLCCSFRCRLILSRRTVEHSYLHPATSHGSFGFAGLWTESLCLRNPFAVVHSFPAQSWVAAVARKSFATVLHAVLSE